MYHNIEEIYYQHEKELAMESLNLNSIKKWILDKIDELIIGLKKLMSIKRKVYLLKEDVDYINELVKLLEIPNSISEDIAEKHLEILDDNFYVINQKYPIDDPDSTFSIIGERYKHPPISIDTKSLYDNLLKIKKGFSNYKFNSTEYNKSIFDLYKNSILYLDALIKYTKGGNTKRIDKKLDRATQDYIFDSISGKFDEDWDEEE